LNDVLTPGHDAGQPLGLGADAERVPARRQADVALLRAWVLSMVPSGVDTSPERRALAPAWNAQRP
jgi:hypothetical protein